MHKLLDCPHCGHNSLIIQEVHSGGVETIYISVKCGGKLHNSDRTLDGCGETITIFYEQTFYGLMGKQIEPFDHNARAKKDVGK